MSSFEDELLQDAEDDARAIAYIKNFMPKEVREKFTDEQLYYCLDVVIDFYATSGILDEEPDANGLVDINEDLVVSHLIKQINNDRIGNFTFEDMTWFVQGEMEYGILQDNEEDSI